jgi:hypothetical protein
MWSRAQLKDKAKVAFKRNYWIVVLVSAILLFLGGGDGSVRFNVNFSDGFELGFDEGFDSALNDYEDYDDIYGDVYEDAYDVVEDENAPLTMLFGAPTGFTTLGDMLAGFGVIIAGIVGMAFLSSLAVQIFLVNPFSVGGKRFFFKNLNEQASIKELGFSFKGHYMNVVKILFFRDLYVFLWSLLFVIPGIVKSYEYRMIPYLLAENPNMSKEEAFELSKRMMDGQKWNAFVLDLSFIGWGILSLFTFGILSIFYVSPYRDMTNAALYEALC